MVNTCVGSDRERQGNKAGKRGGPIKEEIKQRELGACDSSTCSLFPNSITPLLLFGSEMVFGLKTRRTRIGCVSMCVGGGGGAGKWGSALEGGPPM